MGSTSTQSTPEPVAIIGLSCRFAGDASNAGNLWKLLVEGRSAWSEIPPSRFNGNGACHPNPEKPRRYIPPLVRWPVSDASSVYRASVNNFGYGGSNAHVILEQGDVWLPEKRTPLDTVVTNGSHVYTSGAVKGHPVVQYKTKVLVLSARDE